MMRRLFIAVLFLAGCRSQTNPNVQAPPKKLTNPDDERVLVAVEMFRPGAETSQIREALQMISPVLRRPENSARMSLKPDDKKFLESAGILSPDTIAELQATDFRPLDAVYVSGASLFRDAAKSLEVTGLGEVDQAALAFNWAMRRVLLYEQVLSGLPPAATLRAGHGSATDRGLVFLALMRQLQHDGCLIAEPGAKAAPLVGILVQKRLYLFDTRLGRPVSGPGGKGIATWDEALKQPDLLKDSKITPEQVAVMQAYIAAPLESLSGRMHFLESLLAGDESHVGGERIAVATNLSRLGEEIRSAGLGSIGLWIPSLRLDRDFSPPSEGGVDDTGKLLRFKYSLVPGKTIVRRFQRLGIFDELPEKARLKLAKTTSELFEKYDLEPNEMLMRGQFEALARRMERGRGAIEDTDFAQGDDEASMRKLAAEWRERVNTAYLAEIRNEPDAPAKVQSLWAEDDYLLFVLHPEVESVPRALVKKSLSRLVLAATHETLAARTNWITASLSQDKAERVQAASTAQKDSGRSTKISAANARTAWLNARGAWTKYLDRNNIGPSALTSALPEIRFYLQNSDIERALSRWEELQRDLHLYAAARLELAWDMEQTGQDASGTLEALAGEIDQALKNPALAKERAAMPVAALGLAIDGPARWNLLQRDWGQDGNLAWLLESIRLAQKTAH